MKQALFSFAFCMLMFACSKNDIDHPASIPTKAALMAHIWIEDSAWTGESGTETIIYTDPKYAGEYGTEWVYTTYGGGPRFDSTRYEFKEPNKIYYWRDPDMKDTSLYLLIEKLDAKTLVTSQSYGNLKYYANRASLKT
jgi:hypothetical protein